MVRLRLTRMGRKKRPYYRIIAVDSRRRRDGAFLERLGYYHPLEDPATVKIDAEKALKWLRVGAQPSDTVRSLLRREGVWLRFRLEKRKMPEAQIQEIMADWFTRNSEQRKAVEAALARALELEEEKKRKAEAAKIAEEEAVAKAEADKIAAEQAAAKVAKEATDAEEAAKATAEENVEEPPKEEPEA